MQNLTQAQIDNLTQAQIDKHNENIRRQNAAKRATNKKYYYKQEITSLKQLEKNCKRIIENCSMATITKQQHIEKMFASYKNNCCVFYKL